MQNPKNLILDPKILSPKPRQEDWQNRRTTFVLALVLMAGVIVTVSLQAGQGATSAVNSQLQVVQICH
jgi:hypothetical protein